MKRLLYIFISIILLGNATACSKDSLFDDFNESLPLEKPDSNRYDSMRIAPKDTNNNDTIIIASDSIKNDTTVTQTIVIKSKIIGKDIIKSNSLKYKGASLSGQGVAIYNNFMFRLHDRGYCCIYDIKNEDRISIINSFELSSYSNTNHSNCAQFNKEIQTDTNFPLLYVSTNDNTNCINVEKISLEGSQLIQKINILGTSGNTINRNWIMGDDGYLWGLGQKGYSNTPSYTINFYKMKAPVLSNDNQKVTLYIEDAIDYFEDDDLWSNIPKTWQGGKVKNGKLYFLFGTPSMNRQLRIYDTSTHKRLAVVDLNTITTAEPEDLDILEDNRIIIVLNGVDYAILLEFFITNN